MDQMLLWALLHNELARKNRQRRQAPSFDQPFWGREWGVLRTMWAGLERRPPREPEQFNRPGR